jgi:hypothetical protein
MQHDQVWSLLSLQVMRDRGVTAVVVAVAVVVVVVVALTW